MSTMPATNAAGVGNERGLKIRHDLEADPLTEDGLLFPSNIVEYITETLRYIMHMILSSCIYEKKNFCPVCLSANK